MEHFATHLLQHFFFFRGPPHPYLFFGPIPPPKGLKWNSPHSIKGKIYDVPMKTNLIMEAMDPGVLKGEAYSLVASRPFLSIA